MTALAWPGWRKRELRLGCNQGLSHRAVAESLRVGPGTISSVMQRARGAGLDWTAVQAPLLAACYDAEHRKDKSPFSLLPLRPARGPTASSRERGP